MWYMLMGFLLLSADVISKFAAIKYLKNINTLPVAEGIFHLTYVENRGAAFGIFQDGRVFLIIVSVLMISAALYFAQKYKNRSKCLSFGIAILVSGALGNLIDRVFRGFVVDFLDFCLIDYPVFNLADIFVCIGAGLIAIFIIFTEGKENEN